MPSSSSPLTRCDSQPSHLTKTFSVFTTRSSGGTASIRLLFLLNQAIGMRGRLAHDGLCSKLYTLLRTNSRRKRMFYLSHLRHQIRGFDQFMMSVSDGNDDVQRRLCGADRAKLFEHFGDGQHLITQHIDEFVKHEHVVVSRAQLFDAECPRLSRGLDVLLRIFCVPRKTVTHRVDFNAEFLR